MQHSEFVLAYILKAQNKNVVIPVGEEQRFGLYCDLIKAPFVLNQAFVKTESLYLKNLLSEKEALDVPCGVNAAVGDAVNFRADAIIYSADENSNTSIFAGTAFRSALEKIEKFPMAVFVPSLLCKNVIVNKFPEINSRATSAQVTGYISALAESMDLVVKTGCKSLVYTHKDIPNKLLEAQVVKAVSLLAKEYYTKKRISFLILANQEVCDLYNKYL